MVEEPASTIRDVAARAGVSHQTVSRVINGSHKVRETTRKRVLNAIEELNYVPNPMGGGLSGYRPRTIGMVSGDISNWFFATAAASAELEARRHGYFLLIASVESGDDGRGYLRLMRERRTEALILATPSSLSREQLQDAAGTNALLVAIAPEVPRLGITSVDVDNYEGGRRAAAHLLEWGHRRIATITGPKGLHATQARLDGFYDALSAAGVSPSADLVEASSEWGAQGGREATARLLDRQVEFTALFAHTDLITLGAMRELQSRGIRVPADISMIGYDDHPIAEFLNPPLTTLRQPVSELGTRAARLAFDAIERTRSDPNWTPHQTLELLPATLIVRDSVAAPAR